jgi:hypothetical protein
MILIKLYLKGRRYIHPLPLDKMVEPAMRNPEMMQPVPSVFEICIRAVFLQDGKRVW